MQKVSILQITSYVRLVLRKIPITLMSSVHPPENKNDARRCFYSVFISEKTNLDPCKCDLVLLVTAFWRALQHYLHDAACISATGGSQPVRDQRLRAKIGNNELANSEKVTFSTLPNAPKQFSIAFSVTYLSLLLLKCIQLLNI